MGEMKIQTIKILLVEDNHEDVCLLKDILVDSENILFKLRHVGLLGDALKCLPEEGFDLILLDLSLPDSQGVDTFSKVHARAPHIPVIVVSCLINEIKAISAVQMGAQDYLVKGHINSYTVKHSIMAAIERHRVLSEIERERQLEHQLAYFDDLTNLPNRQLFNDRLKQVLSGVDRYQLRMALMFLDLDGFKQINDTLGHDAGDLLLRSVASRLKECIRESDTVARIGGDEFTFILPQINHASDVHQLAQKILKKISSPFNLSGHKVNITGSIGASLYPDDTGDSGTLLKNADMAMYYAKKKGRNKFRFYTSHMNTAARERMSMERDLRTALEKEQFVLFYQPQLDTHTGRISGVEALIRWKHPVLGMVAPDLFIPLAEETGHIFAIGEWVLRTACRQMKIWVNEGLSGLRMATNLSSKQFRQGNLPGLVADILEETGLSASYLDFEITESGAMHDIDKSNAIMNSLQQMGSRISIDDFGTGFSSLSYLKSFPINTLKIDRSFIHDVTSSSDSAAITRAIIAMAQNLNMDVIAEGVETHEQVDFLRAEQCNTMQGYFFSSPVPAEACQQLLHREAVLN